MQKHEFVLPTVMGKRGQRPYEYYLMPQAETLAEKFAGPPDDLFTPARFAAGVDAHEQWPREIAVQGRGPRPTFVGKRILFRRDHILEWIHWLGRQHKAGKRKRVAA